MGKRKNSKASRHHLTPRSRKGKHGKENILHIDWEKHQSWHILFENRTLEEAIELLVRVHRAKGRCVPSHCPLCHTLVPKEQRWSS